MKSTLHHRLAILAGALLLAGAAQATTYPFSASVAVDWSLTGAAAVTSTSYSTSALWDFDVYPENIYFGSTDHFDQTIANVGEFSVTTTGQHVVASAGTLANHSGQADIQVVQNVTVGAGGATFALDYDAEAVAGAVPATGIDGINVSSVVRLANGNHIPFAGPGVTVLDPDSAQSKSGQILWNLSEGTYAVTWYLDAASADHHYNLDPGTGLPLPVPEPETWALMGLGVVGLVTRSRRRKA
ncbi:PEP-CTERM sorting domain-containing protein [Amantichitinum ursilacus]|uniref:PEP-CTERM motif protein n=1 Tax=Amantichitinum ursilacus TaxID=857265 RepID=A0A0N0XIC7_9NEIS|nr:PEP-CTERM sorting domain-containing protein [Amantichitinum ursilacus]KPC52598.1 PEP-CTERM motif protein [Amantichitinum ursilacus]